VNVGIGGDVNVAEAEIWDTIEERLQPGKSGGESRVCLYLAKPEPRETLGAITAAA
jgi:hypothetical protein